jgi:molecular chaperone DnaJ
MKTAEQCYAALGLNVDASDEEVKTAYRERAKKYHPDVSSDEKSKEKFIEIQEAYDCIVNKKFARQGQFQHGGPFEEFDLGGFGFSGFPPFAGGQFFNQQEDFNKVLTLNISFIESCLGTVKTISYTRQDICPACEEYLKKHGKLNISSCKTCGGHGAVQRVMGPMRITQPCGTCAGKGMSIECNACGGAGSSPKKNQISFKINPGTGDGSTLKLTGQADFDYKNNAHGDLYMKIQVTPHKTMTRNGQDIFSKIKVPYLDCILGGDIEFETIHGKDTASIPPLTEVGAVIKKANAGINKSGSHILTIEVELPTSLTPAEKNLLNKIKNSKSKK